MDLRSGLPETAGPPSRERAAAGSAFERTTRSGTTPVCLQYVRAVASWARQVEFRR